MNMKQQRKSPVPEFCDLRLDPQRRLCPKFDAVSLADFPVAQPGEMGFRVVDNCAEEHIQ